LHISLNKAYVTLVCLSIVPKILSRLVFPPPELPRMMTNSPCLMLTETPRRAATPYNPKRYVLWRLSPLITIF